jgi:dimethylaniline monooxygenase (N-oxide forming)
MATRVAIIGAGPVGLMALKNMREDGFDAISFEKRDYIGGLWKATNDGSISVTPHTVFNSSRCVVRSFPCSHLLILPHRFMSAISDFPFPDHHNDFPTADQMLEYQNLYADHFGIRQYIRLSTEVISVRRIDAQWEIATRSKDDQTQREYFDKLLVCTGSFVTARRPHFDGIEKFEGRVLHCIDFPDSSEFKGQTVLLSGLHASTADISIELSKHASKLYLAHKTGVVMVSKSIPQPKQD